jgi:hypothetical protein
MKRVSLRAVVAQGGKIAVRFLLMALVQCSAFEGPAPSTQTHSLCYNRMSTSREQLRALAATTCNGGTPHYLAQSLDLSACPLLVPMRLNFACGG